MKKNEPNWLFLRLIETEKSGFLKNLKKSQNLRYLAV